MKSLGALGWVLSMLAVGCFSTTDKRIATRQLPPEVEQRVVYELVDSGLTPRTLELSFERQCLERTILRSLEEEQEILTYHPTFGWVAVTGLLLMGVLAVGLGSGRSCSEYEEENGDCSSSGSSPEVIALGGLFFASAVGVGGINVYYHSLSDTTTTLLREDKQESDAEVPCTEPWAQVTLEIDALDVLSSPVTETGQASFDLNALSIQQWQALQTGLLRLGRETVPLLLINEDRQLYHALIAGPYLALVAELSSAERALMPTQTAHVFYELRNEGLVAIEGASLELRNASQILELAEPLPVTLALGASTKGRLSFRVPALAPAGAHALELLLVEGERVLLRQPFEVLVGEGE